jgi:hypothetical protein
MPNDTFASFPLRDNHTPVTITLTARELAIAADALWIAEQRVVAGATKTQKLFSDIREKIMAVLPA